MEGMIEMGGLARDGEGKTQLYGFAEDVETAEKLLEGGLRILQLRNKHLADAPFREVAREILARVRRHPGAALIINDRVEIAAEIGADGVHVGPEDDPPERVRARIPDYFILGVSARTPDRAKAAEGAGADYLGVGAVFPTASKADAETIGLEGLRAVMAATSLPVVAIGGIDQTNIRRIRDAGCRYAAVLSALNNASDIPKRVREFRGILEEESKRE
jgi:thiamine-phosphate pyrophosphorylase